jgi:hypothetical protein
MVLAMSLALLPGAAHAAKPDLVVTGKPEVSPEGPSEGHVIGLRSEVTNKKQGKNKTSAAGASVTSLRLTHKPQVRDGVAVSQRVPKLKADESHSGGGQTTLKGFPPGEYAAEVCADIEDKVKERNEKNNCTGIGKIYVTVFSWTGSFGGSSASEEGFTEEWGSDGAELLQVSADEDGRFNYVFIGSVHYSISGSDADGCSYGGAGQTSIPQIGSDGLTLDYHKGQYWGSQGLGGDHPFTWTANCPGESPQDLEGPFDFAGGFIVVDPIDAKPMPFGATKLTDSSVEEIDQTTNRWNWDLTAESASGPRR